MLSTTSVAANGKSTTALLSTIFEMALLWHWSTLRENFVWISVSRYRRGSGIATSIQEDTADYNTGIF
jgi:hypothetical protein